MSLPNKPLARREKYLAKAAGQEVTLPETDLTREEMYLRAIAEGGGGGGVTPEYVAEAIAEAKTDIEEEIPTKTSDLTNDSGYAAIDDTTAAQNKTYSSAKVEEKVAGEEITTTATGSDLTLSTSSGNINALTVYGKSEIVNGSIKSAGEGYAVVDLGTLTWGYRNDGIFSTADLTNYQYSENVKAICAKYHYIGTITSVNYMPTSPEKSLAIYYQETISGRSLYIKDSDYTDATDFKSAMSGVLLCYELADPTQGNTIAVKTDNGTGIDVTMATFTTGTPLRGIPDTDVRDVMTWDGSAGTATKKCGKVRLADLTTWSLLFDNQFYATLPADSQIPTPGGINALCSKYARTQSTDYPFNKEFIANNLWISQTQKLIIIRDTDYTTVEDFIASLGDAELVYELATPTTEQLTTAENNSITGLRTFTPQTHAQNNVGAMMTVEAYAGTANGQAVQELKQDVQSEISALKITQSSALTLTTSGWTNNAQTVTFAHDTAKRNVIDVDPASVEEWASCGILATAETASGITFTCKTVPENALNFKVTSMGVN